MQSSFDIVDRFLIRSSKRRPLYMWLQKKTCTQAYISIFYLLNHWAILLLLDYNPMQSSQAVILLTGCYQNQWWKMGGMVKTSSCYQSKKSGNWDLFGRCRASPGNTNTTSNTGSLGLGQGRLDGSFDEMFALVFLWPIGTASCVRERE